MEALLAAFLESLAASAAGAAPVAEGAIAAAAPAAPVAEAAMTSPMSIGDAVGGLAKQQMAPSMDFYNSMTNPNASMGDMARSAFKYQINQREDDKFNMAPQMGNPYGGMANNYVGGIPSILQNTNSGILPYIGAR
jgi:hypothetical protein